VCYGLGLSISEVVGQDENEVGFGRGGRCRRGQQDQGQRAGEPDTAAGQRDIQTPFHHRFVSLLDRRRFRIVHSCSRSLSFYAGSLIMASKEAACLPRGKTLAKRYGVQLSCANMRPFGQFKRIFSRAPGAPTSAIPDSARQAFCAATGLRPIDDFKAEDILIVGYPKSGNTWMQYLISSVAYGIDVASAPDALIQDLVPDVHFKKFFKPYFPTTFFKSHFLPRPDYRRVIYLLRDGRDAMVSYLHYIEGLKGEKIDFLRLVRAKEWLFPGAWHDHVEQWLANPHGAEMIVVHYEDLKAETVGELRRICEFAGIRREQSVLATAAEKCSFSAMRTREDSFAWENPQIPKAKRFVRRGEVGSHRDEMPAAVLGAFLEEAGPMLRKTGYLK
jgi:Sulfotransferase domain